MFSIIRANGNNWIHRSRISAVPSNRMIISLASRSPWFNACETRMDLSPSTEPLWYASFLEDVECSETVYAQQTNVSEPECDISIYRMNVSLAGRLFDVK